MNIELNKCYRTRDGRKARIICVDRNTLYPIVALVPDPVPEVLVSYTRIGGISPDDSYEDPKDLVSEWVDSPGMDRSVLPAWANKAVAMDSDGQWNSYSSIPILYYSSWGFSITS